MYKDMENNEQQLLNDIKATELIEDIKKKVGVLLDEYEFKINTKETREEIVERAYEIIKPHLYKELEDVLIGFDEHGNMKPKFVDIDWEKCDAMSEEEKDAEIFKGTEYEGMSFKRCGDWDNKSFRVGFASPDFEFENGDVVAIDRTGVLQKIN